MTIPDVSQAEMKAALIAKYPYLANMQDLCDDLRRTAPQHTYANDAELLASRKSCLDLNMQIPSTALPGILTTLKGVYGVLGAQQRIMELLFTDSRELSLANSAKDRVIDRHVRFRQNTEYRVKRLLDLVNEGTARNIRLEVEGWLSLLTTKIILSDAELASQGAKGPGYMGDINGPGCDPDTR